MNPFASLDSSPKARFRTAVHLASSGFLTALLALLATGCGSQEPPPTLTASAPPTETPQIVAPQPTGTPTTAFRLLPTLLFPVGGPGNLELVGQLWGSVEAVSVDGGLVFAGIGPRLVILDISDQARPLELATYDSQGYVTDVYVADGYAFLATEDQTSLDLEQGGLWVLDVADPTNPRLVESFDPPDDIVGLSVSDSFIYARASDAGLVILKRLLGPTSDP